jgi:hypothetical protein
VGSAVSRESSDSRVAPILRNGFKLSDLARLRSFSLRSSEWSIAQEHFNKSNKSAFVSIRSKASCQRWYEVMLEGRLVEIKDMAARIQQERDSAWAYPLPADHLISLVYYNVYRALIQNVELLGLDLNLMYTDDYPSPFTPLSQSATSAIRRLPISLEPTELQKTMAHHPQWDIVPDPVVRDNILRYGEENINDIELCLDMVGGGIYSDTGGDTQEKTGLIIWGEPWDLEGWEVTEAFARKWGWMLRNAPITNSTNRWRKARGEDALDFDTILWLEQVESIPGV